MRYSMLLCFFLLTLSACKTDNMEPRPSQLPVEGLVPDDRIYGFIDQNGLTQNVTVGVISLSKDMPQDNPDQVAVTADKKDPIVRLPQAAVLSAGGFQSALQLALQKANWYNPTNPAYTLQAVLVKQEIPITLINRRVTLIVDYQLKNNSTGNIDDQQRIQMSCPLPSIINGPDILEDMFFTSETETEHLQRQNERDQQKIEDAKACTAKENITQYIRSLNAKF